MAHKIEWSDDAIADFAEITEFIERTSPANANAVVEAIRAASRRLPDFPSAHRIVPEWRANELRETFVHRWRLMYRVLPDRVRIVSVVQGSQLLDNIEGRSFQDGPQQEYVAS